MAAHIVTAMTTTNWEVLPWDQVGAVLNFSCWTEDLDEDDYFELHNILILQDRPALVAWAASILEKYTPVWEWYGRPPTREQWLKVKYNL